MRSFLSGLVIIILLFHSNAVIALTSSQIQAQEVSPTFMNRILTSQEIRFRPLKVKTVLLASADEAQERADQEKVKNENPGQPVALSTSDGGREVALVVFAVVGLVMMIA